MARWTPRGYLTAFQRIDAAIANPWMMVTFLGSPVLTFAALLVHLPGRSPAVPWIAAALLLVAATVLITGAIHLPLNAATRTPLPHFVTPPCGPASKPAGCAGTSFAP